MRIALSLLATLLFFITTASAQSPTTAPVQLTPVQWIADVDTLVAELAKKHINPFTKVTREQFESAAAEFKKRIPLLTPAQIVVGFMELGALIGDAHTMVSAGAAVKPFGVYPFAFYIFTDGPVIAVAPHTHPELLKARIVKLGTMPYDEAAARVARVFPYENESYFKQALPRSMNVPEILQATGVVESIDSLPLTVQTADGKQLTVTLTPMKPGDDKKLLKLPDRQKTPWPKWLRGMGGGNYWYVHLPEEKILFIRYDKCNDDPKKPMLTFMKEVFDLIDNNDIDKLVFDVRNNGGGNSTVAQPLILGIKNREKVNRKNHLFVIIGRATFSSAQMNANDFRKRTNAIIVGEPTGQKPNAFGEVKSFTLPNSGLRVQYSTKRFKTDDADPPSMMPDVLIEQSSEDFFAGRDVIMERILKWSPDQK